MIVDEVSSQVTSGDGRDERGGREPTGAERRAETGGHRVRVHLSVDDAELPTEAEAVRRTLKGLYVDVAEGDVRDADLFIGVFGDRYGDIDPDRGVSRLEADYLSAGSRPRLVYVVPGQGSRDPHLALLLSRIQADDLTSYRRVRTADELAGLVADDVTMVLIEAFTSGAPAAAGAGSPKAPVKAAPGPRQRIPAPWHRLVGREREADDVCELLCGDTRLLTLTGPGGIGKSRLAIEVATRSEHRFPHGAWFVDLAGVRDPALVAPTIAQALGVRESAGALPVSSLKSYLATMQALILLDSFETVIAAAPLVVDLLESAPGVRFFVTSRSVLRVRGEQEYPLPPLAVPAAGEDPAGSPAYQLFRERAEAANPTRGLSATEQDAVAEICRRLDGVPLSLELAAARTRLLSPTQLLGRLGHALDVLGDGPVDYPERQRALRTTLDWDHALLSAEEQVVFRRLSVFPSHFTLAGAERVVDEPGLDVLDLLDALVGKSLVRIGEAVPATGESGFVMLQTVREYAHEHCAAADEEDDVHRRHAAHVLDRVENAVRNGPAELEGWLAVLEHEHGDIRVALDWADRALDVDTLLRMAAALGPFWRSHCHFSEGRRWLERAISLSSGQRSDLRADLLNSAGYLSRARGDYDVAEAQYREALAIREELGDVGGISSGLRFVGNVAFERGDLVGAQEWWERSLAALGDAADDVRRSSVLNNLAVARHHNGDQEGAITAYDEVRAIAERLGSHELQARALMNKANALAALHRISEARESARTAVRMYAALDDTWDLVDALEVFAGADGRCDDPGSLQRAAYLFGGAATLRTALAVRRPAAEQHDYDTAYAVTRARDPQEFDAQFALGAAASVDQVVGRALGVEVRA
jgi:predicted ATPase